MQRDNGAKQIVSQFTEGSDSSGYCTANAQAGHICLSKCTSNNVKGRHTITLVIPERMQYILSQVQEELRNTHPDYDVAIDDLQYYYESTAGVIRINNTLMLSFEIPLSAGPYTTFTMYEFKVVHVPVSHAGKSPVTTTKVMGVKLYFALSKNKEYYMELDEFQLGHCEGKSNYRICDPYMVQSSTSRNTCSLGLFRDSPEIVKNYCSVEYRENKNMPTEILPLGKGQILPSTQESNCAIHCDKQSPRLISSCAFCIILLNCSCSLRGTYDYIPPTLENCDENNYRDTIKFPINAMSYLKFYDKLEGLNITGSTFKFNHSRHPIPRVDVLKIDTQNVVQQDENQVMNLDKIISLMKDDAVIYQSKADKIYADTSMITSMFGSPYGKIALAIMTCINAASICLGIVTFFKVRRLAILWALIRKAGPNQAFASTAQEQGCPSALELAVYVVLLMCLLHLGRTTCRPALRSIYHYYCMQHRVMHATGPVLRKSCVNKIYLRVIGDQAEIPLYLCTITTCPTSLAITKPPTEVTMAYYSRRYYLHGYILMAWYGTQIHDVRQQQQYSMPCRVRVPLGKGGFVQELLKKKSQTSTISRTK